MRAIFAIVGLLCVLSQTAQSKEKIINIFEEAEYFLKNNQIRVDEETSKWSLIALERMLAVR